MRDGARFGEHVLGKDARQLVLADHHLHVDAEVVGRAEDFDDAADGRARGRGPAGDLDIDDQAFEALRALCAFEVLDERLLRGRGRDAAWRMPADAGENLLARRNEDGLRHALVEGDHDVSEPARPRSAAAP